MQTIFTETLNQAFMHAGLEMPEKLGKRITRFSTNGERGDTAGWLSPFPDGVGATFGNFRTGDAWCWQQRASDAKGLTPDEIEKLKAKAAEHRRLAEEDRAKEMREAAVRLRKEWEQAQPADTHPYLTKKGVKSYGLRVNQAGDLMVPMYKGGELVSYQRIQQDLTRRNATGGTSSSVSFTIGDTSAANRVYIAEGYATGATVHEVTGAPVVVSFGANNLLATAMGVRAAMPAAEIVFAVDDDRDNEENTGMIKASAAAEVVDGLLAFPEFGSDRPKGASDFNDVMACKGKEAVLSALNAAGYVEGLLKFYEYQADQLRPVEFVLDGFIATGMTLIAGSPGVGKTTAVVTAAGYAAGLCDKNPEFVPTIRRKVYYITEDPAQVERIVFGLRKHGVSNASAEEWAEWFHIITAERKKPEQLALTVRHIRRRGSHRCGPDLNHYMAEPLTVLDTSSATLDMDDENNNAEAGKAIAYVKQALETAPLWLMGHTAKGLKRADLKSLSFRGAGAFEGDCHAVSYLFQEDENDRDTRFWALGKHRYEAEFKEVQILSMADYLDIKTAWGKVQRCWYRIGNLLKSSEAERIELRVKRNQEDKAKGNEARCLELRGKITGALLEAAKDGEGLSKSKLKKIVGGKDAFADEQIEIMHDQRLVKITSGPRNARMVTLS